MKKIIAAILSIAFATSALTACQGAAGSSKNPSQEETKRSVYNGTHTYEVEDTSQKLVENGATAYRLVLPTEKSTDMRNAETEFSYFFKEATGIQIAPSSNESARAENGKYISLGETNLLKASGIEYSKTELTADGFQIVTKDDDVYLLGGSDIGVLNAVYGFMNVYFNYEQYYIDCYEIDKNVKNIAFKKMNVKDIPDIAQRNSGYGMLNDAAYTSYDDIMFVNRMHFSKGTNSRFLKIYEQYDDPNSKSELFHNTSAYISPKLNPGHEKWFSDANGSQLCYTAHGDEGEFKLMVEECAKKVINTLKIHTPETDPLRNIVTFTMEDNQNVCTCTACTDSAIKYGTGAGAVVIFVNAMNKIVREWMNQPENAAYKRDDLKIVFFAYSVLTDAPAKYNETTGKYDPIDEKVALDDGVGVWLALVNMDYQQSVYAEANKKHRANIDAWSDLSNQSMMLWYYCTNFSYFMYQYDNTDFITDGYAYAANAGAYWIFNQGQHYQTGTMTGWHNLKMYLDSKLQWNSSLDIEELTDNWFNAMFKEAAPTMKKLYMEMRAYQYTVLKEHGVYQDRSIYADVEEGNGAWWPMQTMLSWMDKADKAKQQIASYKQMNAELYQSLCDHIDAEWLSPAYVVLKFYKDDLMEEEKKSLIYRFSEFVKRSGISNYNQKAKLSAFIAQL